MTQSDGRNGGFAKLRRPGIALDDAEPVAERLCQVASMALGPVGSSVSIGLAAVGCARTAEYATRDHRLDGFFGKTPAT